METGPNAELFRDIHANLIRYGATELEVQRGIDIAEYVTQRYPLSLFPPSLITSVQKATGGHALFVSQILEFCDDLTLGTMCGKTCAPIYQEVRDAVAHRPVSKCRH